MITLVRARLAHTPRNPFEQDDALEVFDDGALAFADDGRILAAGAFEHVQADHSGARVEDARGAFLVPGFVDTHVHWPQLGVVGAMGLELMEWLSARTLPEEARLADIGYARPLARDFVRGLAANGTTSALVFGSHFPEAQDAFFEEADASGLRIASGLVVSDRDLLPELRGDPGHALQAGRALAARWHGHGRLRYAVTPRFSISCSEDMLESCGELHAELDGALLTSHINESENEVGAVADRFPWAGDYLETYEQYGLVGPRTVFAHDVHVTDAELDRLAAARAGIANCPIANASLGSGIFPMRRHLEHGVRFGLGTDVGAGTGLSLLKEALASYQAQMVASQRVRLTPAHLLWLVTLAGAEILGLDDVVGDLTPGKAADYVLLRPPPGGTLEATLARSRDARDALGAVFALAREESVSEVRVAGKRVWPRDEPAGHQELHSRP